MKLRHPFRVWVVDGQSYLTPKTGAGLMASAYQDSVTGFGLPLTPVQLEIVNEFRAREENNTYICADYGAPQALCKLANLPELSTKPPLKSSPGLRIIFHGKARDGYWTSAHAMVQAEDHTDVMRALFPWCGLVHEYDHSGTHGTLKPDGLRVGKTNTKFGGRASEKHETTLTAGCLGPHPALVKIDGVVHDYKLKAGDVQVSS